MELLQAWQESLCLLRPKNLKLFLLVTLKAFIETWSILLRKFWWLFILWVISIIIAYSTMSQIFFNWFSLFCSVILGPLLLLAIRPSVQKKNLHYFWQNKRLWLYASLFLVICSFPMLTIFDTCYQLINKFEIPGIFWEIVFNLLTPFFPVCGSISSLYWGMATFIGPATPFLVIFILFLYDSFGSCKDIIYSFKRSFLMIFYNYPFFLIMFFIYHFVFLFYTIFLLWMKPFGAFKIVGTNISFIINYPILLILISFYLCLLTNFYTKQIHEKPEWYL